MDQVESLTSSDIEFGRKVLESLKNRGFGPKGVFWLLNEDQGDWKLVVVTDAVDKLGPRLTYLQISNHLRHLPSFQTLKVEALSPKTPMVRALLDVFGVASSVEGARLQNTMVNGIRVPGAYLYELRS